MVNRTAAPFADVGIMQYVGYCKPALQAGQMKRFLLLVVVLLAGGCENIDIDIKNGDGSVTVNDECTTTSAAPLYAVDPPGVIATCDDDQPCTWDTQCTPCEALPPSLHVKATCVPFDQLSPACFDMVTNELIYTGCTHFIYWTKPGVINDCFPVKFPNNPNSEAHAGVCNMFGICVENP